mgnify:CR=1 FL=1
MRHTPLAPRTDRSLLATKGMTNPMQIASYNPRCLATASSQLRSWRTRELPKTVYRARSASRTNGCQSTGSSAPNYPHSHSQYHEQDGRDAKQRVRVKPTRTSNRPKPTRNEGYDQSHANRKLQPSMSRNSELAATQLANSRTP